MTLENLSKTKERPVSTCPHAEECEAIEELHCKYLLGLRTIGQRPGLQSGVRRRLLYETKHDPEFEPCPHLNLKRGQYIPRPGLPLSSRF